MEVDAKVRISVQKLDGSKMLLFDRPVKVLELSKTEAVKIGASLIADRQGGFTSHLRRLIEEGYFKQARKLSEIKSTLFLNGIDVKTTTLHILLCKMVDRGELKREGQKRSYQYREV